MGSTKEGSARILVVDDAHAIRDYLDAILRTSGYEVRTADSGVAALELFRQEKFDLVITDMVMKPMDGLDLLKQCKAIAPGTAVIIISAYNDSKTVETAMKEGAYHFLSKPFTIEEVLTVIGNALMSPEREEKCRSTKEGSLHFGCLIGGSPAMHELRLDCANGDPRTLSRNSHCINQPDSDVCQIVIRDLRHDLQNKIVRLAVTLDLFKLEVDRKILIDLNVSKLIKGLEEIHYDLDMIMVRLRSMKSWGIYPSFVSVSMRLIVRELLNQFRPSNTSIAFTSRCQDIHTTTDPNLLTLALRQIVQNATEAIYGHGHISIAVSCTKNDMITIRVIDDGCGIPKEVLTNVFNPTFSYGKSGHSGMGLAMASTVISFLGGTISITTKEGKRTSVRVQIPWRS
jgi:DNA-binding response OmpR family regulator